jgi:drug/metabolite transporter (DMT)-like permease
MMPTEILGTVFALLSAAAWGTGDFSGGVAVKGTDHFKVTFVMTVPGIVILAFLAFAFHEPFPPVADLLWAAAAGATGVYGIASLYRGLSIGSAAVVAPTAAVLGAGIPMAFGSVFLGLPGRARLLGFFLAMIGIWLVSRPAESGHDGYDKGLGHAIVAGTCFGGYFIFMGQVEHGLVFGPLTCAKLTSIVVVIAILSFRRESVPGLFGNRMALLAGFFDAGGNAFYMLARQYTRLDVAAVLSSMYPLVTVILASLVLRQKVNAAQWCGVALCLAAIGLIVV